MAFDARLVLFRLHQRFAPLQARERVLGFLEATPASPGRFVFGSCHRVEIYAAIPCGAPAAEWLADRVSPEAPALFPASAVLEGDREVARHLFELACGLDSVIVGEGQILGQLRRTYDAARASAALHPTISELVRRALALGRVVRASSPLGGIRRSVGSLAVEEGVRLLPDASRSTALVVGAGEMGKLSARALRGKVAGIVVANRDSARGEDVARAIGARAVPLARTEAELADADLVISAADSRGALLTAEVLERRLSLGPLVLIDIAVPRSVEAAARAMPGLVYRSVDDLVGAPQADLGDAIADAQRRCDAAADAFAGWHREREAAAAIRTLRERADRVREARLRRALHKLRHLEERDREVVASLAHALTNELLHAPTVALRRSPDRAAVALELFGADRR